MTRWRLRRLGGLGLLAAGVCHAAGWPGPSTAVRFAPERDYGPFVFQRADGQIDGLSVQMLGLLGRQAQLSVTTLPARPLQQQLDALRGRQADLVSSLRATPERAEYALFTLPYVTVQAVVVMRADRPPTALSALDAQPVAVGQGYAVEAVVRQRHPAVAWQAVPDDAAGLRGVAERRFTAAVVDSASFAHVTRTERLEGLVIVAPADFDYTLSFAVRKDWPELRDALDTALRELPQAERLAVVERWIGAPPTPAAGRTPWSDRLGWALLGGGVLLAVVFGVIGQRRRHAKVAE